MESSCKCFHSTKGNVYHQNRQERQDAASHNFEVAVNSPDFKFSAAHFVAFKGFREKLHGHNYTVELRISGPVGSDGYVIDFGILKTALRKCCKSLNESVIIPLKSDVLDISFEEQDKYVKVYSPEYDVKFIFPKTDCSLLPIVHSTAEELAVHLTELLVKEMTLEFLQTRQIAWIETTVAERPTQAARYRHWFDRANE